MVDRNFWGLMEGFFSLAPMEDVTDTVFRELVLKNSSGNILNVLFSEFLSTDGFCHDKGREKVIHRLKINESELQLVKRKGAKLVAQIWGTDPEKFNTTARYIANNTFFDGIDINMGCPQKNIIKKGACSALINDPVLANEIIMATIEACELPVSVKTRLGFKSVETEKWVPHLLQTPIKALTIHGRTQNQMSEGDANWNEIKKVVELRNQLNPHIKIVGNGDVKSISDGKEKMRLYKVDGVMIGRGIFSDFWLFNENGDVSVNDKLEAMMNHAMLFDTTWNGTKPWQILRRFFKIYTHNLPQAAQLRDRLMKIHSLQELTNVIAHYKDTLTPTVL